MPAGDKVRCLGYFGPNRVREDFHYWTGLYDGDGDRYLPDAPDGEQYNVVGPGTNYPIGLSLEKAMKWYWKAKNWRVTGSVSASQSCVLMGQLTWNEEDEELINSRVVQTISTLNPDSGPITGTFPPLEHITSMKKILCSGRYQSLSRTAGFDSPYDDEEYNFYTSGRTAYDVVTYTGDGGGGFSVVMTGEHVKVGSLYWPRLNAYVSAYLGLYGRWRESDHYPSPFGPAMSTRSKRGPQDFYLMMYNEARPAYPSLQYVSDRDVPSAASLTIDGESVPLFQPPDYVPYVHNYTEGTYVASDTFSAGSLAYVSNIALTIEDEF